MAALLDFTSPVSGSVVAGLSDAALLDAQRALAHHQRQMDAWAVALSVELGRRSAPELGGEGLARRLGARTPEVLLQKLTGGSSQEANRLLRVGATPLVPVAAAVDHGIVSLAAADAIVTGLGKESPAVSIGDLAQAATELVAAAQVLSPEQLLSRARAARVGLDVSAVELADAQRRDLRALTWSRRADGMEVMHAVFDPESGARVRGILDGLTSPRRGGPRFVRSDLVGADRGRSGAEASADRLERDPRTTAQLALDGLVHLVEAGASTDPAHPLPAGPAVKIAVTVRDLLAGRGPAFIEGRAEPTTVSNAERVACDSGIRVALLDDTGRALDLGRTQRLFSQKQREMLALRDGGCMHPDCDRPPSWCEAHHITEWERGGRTDVRDGVLLCRYHHLHLHNTGGRIRRVTDDHGRDQYLLIPPRSRDPQQRPIPLAAKSDLLRRLLRDGG